MTQMDSIDTVVGYDRHHPQHHASYRAQPSRAQYDHEKHDYRPLDETRYHNNGHGIERGHHGRSEHQYKSPKILLDDALHDLLGALETAADYYGSFIEEFDRDIQYIRLYAGPRILEHLWVKKILSSDERSANSGRSQSRQAEGPNPGRPGRNYSFQSVGREVLDCFGVVKRSHASSRDSSINPQTANRIRKKLEQTSREIFKLMRTAVQQKADADALITEMEMVLTFLDKTAPQRGQREAMDSERDQGPEDYERPNKDGSDGQGGFKDMQEGFKEGQGSFAINGLSQSRRQVREYQ